MFSVLFFFLIASVNCRILPKEVQYLIRSEDASNIFQNDLEDSNFDRTFESVRPIYLKRVSRQVHGSLNTNPDGSSNLFAKMPIVGNEKNVLSGVGGLYGAKNGAVGAASAGLAWDNVNGHGASITGKHIPGLGNQLTGAGKLNLLHNDHHDVTANAFGTRTFPNNPVIPNFNTYGGSLDYMYNNKVGASLGASHTDLFKRNDLSLMGNLNLYRNPTSSLDFNAGATRSMSPFLPKSNWQPSFGMTYSKYF